MAKQVKWNLKLVVKTLCSSSLGSYGLCSPNLTGG